MFRRGLRRAALLYAWSSDSKLQCLFATFLSTSLDDFEALGVNLTLLERSWSLLGRIWGTPGGLGAAFGGSGAVLERSWPVLERSWRPSCGNVIFERVLVRFWSRPGRPRGEGPEPKLHPNRIKIEDEKEDAKRSASRSSSGGLGAVLERSWAILADLEAILGRFGGGWGRQNQCFR